MLLIQTSKSPLLKSTLSESRMYHDVLYTERKRKCKDNSNLIEKFAKVHEEAAEIRVTEIRVADEEVA